MAQLSNAELAAKLTEVVDGWQGFVNENLEWLTSVADNVTITHPFTNENIVTPSRHFLVNEFDAIFGETSTRFVTIEQWVTDFNTYESTLNGIRTQTETARNAAVAAQGNAEAARDTAIGYRDTALTYRDQADTFASNANTARLGAEAARDSTTNLLDTLTASASTGVAGSNALVSWDPQATSLAFTIPTGPQGPTGTLEAFSVDGGAFTDVYDTFTIDGGSFA